MVSLSLGLGEEQLTLVISKDGSSTWLRWVMETVLFWKHGERLGCGLNASLICHALLQATLNGANVLQCLFQERFGETWRSVKTAMGFSPDYSGRLRYLYPTEWHLGFQRVIGITGLRGFLGILHLFGFRVYFNDRPLFNRFRTSGQENYTDYH